MLAALETSTRACSVALWDLKRDVLLEETFLGEDTEGAASLVPALGDLLARHGARATALDAVAVAVGPGSFTGLRVGLATAQGLTLPDGRAVFGIPTLAAMAESLRREGWFGEALCLLDAQRGECFVGHHLVREEGCEPLGEVRILKPEVFPMIARGPVLCVGPAALRYESAIREALGARALFPLNALHRPRASSVASLASRRWREGERPGLEVLKPMYLRPPAPDELMKNK